MKRVLITGGSGFLGAWIIRRLNARGLEARVFDIHDRRQTVAAIAGDVAHQLDWRVGDIADGDAVGQAMQGCDGVIHLAGVLTPDCAANPVRGARINLIGTLNVFEAAHGAGHQAGGLCQLGRRLWPARCAAPLSDDALRRLQARHRRLGAGLLA